MGEVNPASLSPILAGLFPQGVVATELRESADAALLLPEERQSCCGFALKRLEEFAAGRACARRALAELGIIDFPLPADDDRRPCWPRYVAGSITHTAGFCGAAVAGRDRFSAIGLDAEQIARVTSDIWPQICVPEELASLKSRPQQEWAKIAAIIFSAKEAFYKCQYDVTRRWLEFHDIAVEVDDEDETGGVFTVNPSRGLVLVGMETAPLNGRFRIAGDLVLAGIALEKGERERIG